MQNSIPFEKHEEFSLSKREIECLAEILKEKAVDFGCIAKELNLSKYTVQFYLKNIKTKFNLHKTLPKKIKIISVAENFLNIP
ncbi:MAG: hypothetical protein A2X78_02015 [Gammaproteobacteria bacterium GWE2_37_16]|nr:MAG: hypothetical protein A2X78_02015 [Gammaproteobacteria bacterium GWE2_37_16]